MGWLKKKKKAVRVKPAPKVLSQNQKRVVAQTMINAGRNIAAWNRPRIEALVHVTTSIATLHYLISKLHYGTKRLIRYTEAHAKLISIINDWRYTEGRRGVSVQTLCEVLEDEGVFHYRPRPTDRIPDEGHDTISDWATISAVNMSAALMPSYEVPFMMVLYDYMGESKRTVKEFAVWLYNLDAGVSDLWAWIKEISSIKRANVDGVLKRPCVDWQADVLRHLDFGDNPLTDEKGLTLMDSKVEAEAACRYLSKVWELVPGGMSNKRRRELGLV